MKRRYLVVCQCDKGIHTHTSTVTGFLPFERVSGELIKQWIDYVKEETGADKATVVNFMRLK